MKTTVTESLNNIETFMKKEHKGLWGMMQGEKPGAIAKILTLDRFYFMMIEVDENLDKVFLDIHPQCVCEKPYRQMANSFINAHTSTYKSGRIDVDESSGEVKIRIETQISDHPVSVQDLNDMEHLAVNISDGIERKLDKLCHGVWFDENDPELMGSMERKRKRIMDGLKNALAHNDNDSDDDDDDDNEALFPSFDDDGGNDGSDDDEFKNILKMISSMAGMNDTDDPDSSDAEDDEPIDGDFTDSGSSQSKTYKLYIVEVSSNIDIDAVTKTLEQTLGMNRNEALSAISSCPACIAEAVNEADMAAIIEQLEELGVKIKSEINSID